MSNADYQKLFDESNPDEPLDEDLNKLALIMSGQTTFPDATFLSWMKRTINDIFENLGDEPPKIPSGYTYLGQFIIHDISFDEHSERHSGNTRPWEIIRDSEEIKRLRNLRKPTFDLETIYGYEKPTNPDETPRSELMQEDVLPLLKLSKTASDTILDKSYPNDLLRKNDSVKTNIVDPRNDENLPLAQTQVAFTKFHNAMVVELNKLGKYNYQELFDKARKLTIRYYQTIILSDFLPRIIRTDILEFVSQRVNTEELSYQPKADNLFLPLEFTVAAFRFGHSMIREKYNFNKVKFETSLDDILMFTSRGQMGGNIGRKSLPSIWIINWYSFYEFDGSTVNYAEPINTELPKSLQQLTPTVRINNADGRASSLAALDLFRGRRFGLLTGQEISQKMFGEESISAEDIGNLIMGKKFIDPHLSDEEARKIKERLYDVFRAKTPLWFYILAEAEIQEKTEKRAGSGFINAGKLGKVGSQLVAETILQLLYLSEYSILNQKWESYGDFHEDFLLKSDGTFGMPEMLRFIKGMEENHHETLYADINFKFNEINPLG